VSPFGRRTPPPHERAEMDEASKRFELDEERFDPEEEAVRLEGSPMRVTGGGVRPAATTLVVEDADLRGDLAEREGFIDLPEAEAVPALAETAAPVPRWRLMLEVFVQNRLAVVSSIVLAIIVLGCFVGPHFYVTNQTNQNLILQFGTPNLPPSSQHWLGTDLDGYDELGRIMYGGQYSLGLGFFAGLITILVGTVYGMVSGFFGGVTDSVMMRLIDAALAIPYLFLLVALVSIFGQTTTFLLLVIGLTGWWGNSRIIRGDALVIRDLEYSVASRSMGGSKWHVIRRHVYPNSISNIVTVGTFSIADAILALSALGFIGLGVLTPATDWGTMMNLGTQSLINDYWWQVFPVAVVFVTVILCVNYIGDALRDVFEVRLRQR
jgi:peptide/nickel transport system permease protein